MKEEIYFCLHLSADEHDLVATKLQDLCSNHGLELAYYREVKTEPLPCVREVKVRFKGKRSPFFKFMSDESLWNQAMRWEDGHLVEWVSQVGAF